MILRSLTLLLLLGTLHAESRAVKIWRWSLVALIAGNSLDVASTVGQYECNPVLSRGQFGARAVAIKGGVALITIVAERRILRNGHGYVPADAVTGYRPLVIANFATGAALSGIAVRNWRSPYRK